MHRTETILKKQIEHLKVVKWYFDHYDTDGLNIEIAGLEKALEEIRNE